MLFRFVIRNLKKRPFLALIKILGLALGFSGILFISLFLKNELSYDRFHPDADRIYRFTLTNPSFLNNNHFARIYNSEQIPELASYFPEIENYVRIAPIRGGVIMNHDKFYSINEAFISDSTFFNVFEANLLVGDKQTVLNAPGSMVISSSFAQKVFGTANPIGEIFTIPAGQYYDKKLEFTVKGVMNDFPQNSHFHPDLITTPEQGKISWWAWTYLLLKQNVNPEKIISGYATFLSEQGGETSEANKTIAHLQKISDIHLHSDKLREIETNGNMTNIFVLAIAALFLLLISMSNYSSLNLGMAGFNQKFLALNKIMGSSKHTNLKYFFTESLIILGLSLLITILISLPINKLITTYFDLNLLKGNLSFILLTLSLLVAIGVLAGIQPVLKQIISKLETKSSVNLINNNNLNISKTIIVMQYALSIVLIAGVLIISRQNRFVMNHSMGVSENNVICFESVHSNVQEKFELFKSELLKFNSIESVSAMMEPPGGEANDQFKFEIEGQSSNNQKQNNLIGVFPCDYSFAKLFNLTFLGGNNFSDKNNDVDGSGEYIINETAMHYLNYASADQIIGKGFKLIFSSDAIKLPQGKITGVVKDFHLSSMKKKVGPLVLFKRDKLWLMNFVVAFKPGMREAALSDIQKTWQNLFPAYPFNYESVGSMYKKVYHTELLQAKLLSLFTFIALFICSMGLLGISLLTTQKRIKEIGIRKVNGAKASEVMAMLNKNFVLWVAIAFVIATPIAWYAMHKWLENFAYRTELSWWIFAMAGLLALGIALLTVSFQSWRAATKNPVEALRYE